MGTVQLMVQVQTPKYGSPYTADTDRSCTDPTVVKTVP